MQRLGEMWRNTRKTCCQKKSKKKDKEKPKNNNDKPTPYKTEQQKLATVLKEKQSTLQFFTKI